MTTPTDQELGDLLVRSFRAHEGLADPDRAVAIASRPVPARPVGRVLVAVAAAVALVAGGTTYAVSHSSGSAVSGPTPGAPSSGSTLPSGRVLHTDAENRAYTQALVRLVAARLAAAAPPLSRRATADQVAPLKRLMSFSGPYGGTYGVNQSLFWLVPGNAKDLARWYVDHPLAGYHADGADPGEGPDGGIGGSSLPDGGWADEVYFYAPGDHSVQGSAAIQVQTTQLGDRTGVRATIFGEWYPARPAASYADGVRSVTVTRTLTSYSPQTAPRIRTWTIRDPARVTRIEQTYDALAGAVPFFHSCPAQLQVRTYRIVLHGAAGDVVVTTSGGCYDWLSVRRDGHQVAPQLAGANRLITAVGRP